MVAVAILSIVLLVLGELLQWGLRAHRKGEAARKAQSLAREIAGHLTAQIGTAVPLATYSVPPNANKDFQSAVIWPDCYEANHSSFSSGFFRRERTTENLPGGTTSEVDRVYNRLIFSRPGKQAGSDYNARDYRKFVYVEYLVDPADPRRLYRRIYPVQKDVLNPSAPPNGVDTTIGSFQRWPLETFFSLTSGQPGANANMITNLSTDEELVAFELPKAGDQLSFVVEHTKYTPSTPQQPPKVPKFEPSNFTVRVTVALDKNPGQMTSGDFLGNVTLSEQARVRAGN